MLQDAERPKLIRLVVTEHMVSVRGGERQPCWVAVLAAVPFPIEVRAVTVPCKSRSAAVRKAVQEFRAAKRVCNCRPEHLTLDECRTTRRWAKTTERRGVLYYRALSCGDEVVVYPRTYGKARLCLTEPGACGYISRGFCYGSPARALEAARVWDGTGDPLDGWHRDVVTGRRRPDGDPARETVRR